MVDGSATLKANHTAPRARAAVLHGYETNDADQMKRANPVDLAPLFTR